MIPFLFPDSVFQCCCDSCVLSVHLSNICWGVLFVFVKHASFKSLLKVYYWSVFVNLPKRSTAWVIFYFGLSLHIFQLVRHCLWKMCATPGACVNKTGLFSLAAAVVPQSKSTKLCSSSAAAVPQSKSIELCSSLAAVVPQSKSTKLCSSSAAAVPQSKSTEMWSSALPFHDDLWYFGTGQTNILIALCCLFGKTYKPAYSSTTQVI